MMKKDTSAEDTISEEVYTAQMASASTSPKEDSPGDSESDAGLEYQMGLDYLPGEKDDPDEVIADSAETLVTSEPSDLRNKDPHHVIQIPETAVVVSSDQPSHRMDRDTPSDTH